MSERLCPCCGHPVTGIPVNGLSAISLSKQEKTIVDELLRVYPKSRTTEALVDALYSLDPNGGPDNPKQVVAVLVCRLRKRLPETGWTIPSNKGGTGRYGSYRLELLSEVAA